MSAPLILVADDHDDSRELSMVVLEHAGYRVMGAEDGEEAVRLARSSCPDLVLLDLSMPRLDGWETTRTLRSDAGTAHVRIVALSGHAEPARKERAAEAGVDVYLVKPVDQETLLAAIATCLATRRT